MKNNISNIRVYTLINYFIVLILLFLIISCSNVSVVVEGAKNVTKKKTTDTNEKTKITKSEDKQNTTGHFKIGNPYIVKGITYYPSMVKEYKKIGIASWYGPKFDKKLTANGETFYQNEISAAHKTLPLPSIVKVTNLVNGREYFIRVNDRGPFVNDRIIDLSKAAAIKLGIYSKGTEKVEVELIDVGPHLLEKKFLNHSFLTEYAKSIEKQDIQKEINNSSFLQVGAFSSRDNAIILKNEIQNKINSTALIVETLDKKNNKIFKVYLGPYKNKKSIDIKAEKLRKLGYSVVLIKREKK